MQAPTPSTGPPATFRSEDKQSIQKFEEAWQKGIAPRLEDYLTSRSPAHTELLAELVKIDMEYRWRQPSPRSDPQAANRAPGLRLEDYTRQFPELLKSRNVLCELIAEEYRARHRWCDRPAHAEYLKRYPDFSKELRELLPQLDAELAREFAREKGRPIPGQLVGNPRTVQPMPADTTPGPVTIANLKHALKEHSLLQ